MAAAIPAAIGVGGSIIGGIQGKGAAKRQEKLAQQQLAQLQPLINAQVAGTQFSLDQARQLYPEAAETLRTIFGKSLGTFDPLVGDYRSLLDEARGRSSELYGMGKGQIGGGEQLVGEGRGLLQSSLPYLSGAANALNDLQQFYRPFMFDGQRAIDRFLPSAGRVNQLMAPEFGNINQGYRSAQDNIARFAPRGGGRVSTMARADIDRQKQLSDVFFQGRQGLADRALGAAFQGAQGEQNRANSLQSLGFGQGQLGLSTIGQGLNKMGLGLNTIGAGTSLLGTQGGLAQNAMSQGLQALGLGGSAAGNLSQLASATMGQGLSGGQGLYNLYNQQANRAFESMPGRGGGQQLGGFLVDLFSNKGVQDKIGNFFGGLFGGGKKNNILPGTDFNYGYGQG